MKKNIIRFFITSIIVMSFVKYSDCQNSSQPVLMEISGAPISTLNNAVITIRDILIVEKDLLIIGDDGINLFHFYSLNNWSKKNSFGIRGEGPDEYGSIPQVAKIGDLTGHISVYDYSTLTSSLLNIIDFDTDNEIEVLNTSLFDSEIGLAQEQQFVTKDILVGHGGLYDCKLVITTKDTIIYVDYLPEIEGYQSHQFLSLIYSGHLAVKPDSEQFVFAMNYFDRIEIYDIEGTLLNACSYYSNNDNQIDDLIDSKRRKNYYKDVRVTEKFIYGLYNGRSNTVIEQIFPKLTGGLFEIHVFNWNGEIKKILELDQHISLIAIDINDNFLIGFDPTSEEFPICYFSLD